MSDASGSAKSRVMAVIDAGPRGSHVLDCAIARARDTASELVLLSVIPDIDSVDTDLASRKAMPGLEHPLGWVARDRAEALLASAHGRATAAGVTVGDTRIVCGRARDAIAAAARSLAVDTIVVGARAHGWPRCLLGGNLLRHLMHRTPCEIIGIDPRDDRPDAVASTGPTLRSRDQALTPP